MANYQYMMSADDVARELNCSKSHAYKLVKSMNDNWLRKDISQWLEQAKQLLRELAEISNAVQSNEIFDMAAEQGISKRTLENAKKELGIKAKKINNSWYWELDRIKAN